jgi:pimeloyl-ACP methyl ester carboxylesterase
MSIVFGITGVVLICLVFLIGRYLHNNIHYNEVLMSKVNQAGFENKQVTLPDGSVISYGEGPSNGPALLLIHGQTVAWQDYDKVLPYLSKSFHVFAVDCYGHGESSHEVDLYSCKTNGEALIWFMNNVIKENCYLSGHSSGGILAAWIAANVPEQIDGLVLEDPPLFHVTPEEIQKEKGAFAWYDAYIVTHGFINQQDETDFSLYYLKHSYLLTLFGGLQDKIVQSAMKYRQKNPNRPIQIAWVPYAWLRPLLYMDNYDPKFGNAFYDGSWMKDIDQEYMLKSIKCPVTYLKAKTQYGKDGVLYAANTDDNADKVQSLISNCERINIKSGHDIHFEHPDVFISACEKLLNEK